MNIPRLAALDDSTTDRGRDILYFMRSTTSGDLDVDLSALVAVAVMMFLKINHIPVTQDTTNELTDRLINTLEVYYQEVIDGS